MTLGQGISMRSINLKFFFALALACAFSFPALSQSKMISGDSVVFDAASPEEYTIAAKPIIEGAGSLDQDVLIAIAGLYQGDKIKIPGEAISNAIKNLWKEGYFEDVSIVADKIDGKDIFIRIVLKERPRIVDIWYSGIKKGEREDIKDKLSARGVAKGRSLTENALVTAKNTVLEHLVDKGYMNANVVIVRKKDTALTNAEILYINITKGPKVRIREVDFHGNANMKSGKLRRAMKDTKRKRWHAIFNSHTLLESEYEKDKGKVIEKYLAKGYRDAKITRDTIYKIDDRFIGIDIYLNEGRKYYFRNITWVGNSKYSSKDLDKTLGIKRGDIFNQSLLDSRLQGNPNGTDVSSLYMDDGYLFFQVNAAEVLVEGDSIDMEIRIYEGKQAIINKVTVKGNTKTNDHVIMREIRTRPGQLFRRSDVIRSQRELSVLGYFDTEKMGVNPVPHPENGTVDIEYVVEEKSSDQLELSGGFGQNRVVGSLGVSFNNFSARNLFNGKEYTPLPSGDGQRLSIRAQSNGAYYQSLNMSFTEPWLGGKKPHSFSVTPFVNRITNGRTKKDPLFGELNIWGISTGLGMRNKWPDDFFITQFELNYQYYVLKNYRSVFSFDNGFSNDFNLKYIVSRSSADDNIFPKNGSVNNFSIQLTPPWSLGKDMSNRNPEKKYNLLEYYKVKVTSAWYTTLVKGSHPLVLYNKLGYGFLGYYNKTLGLTPFQRFYLGGSGLTGYNPLDGREIIAMRGYDDGEVFDYSKPMNNPGGASLVKYTTELRFPISLNPSASIYALAFGEAGNSWGRIRDFKPFDVKRSAGVGLRFFLPMFGMLGFDYGWRFDDVPFRPGMQRSQFHFTIGYNLGEL